MAKYIGLLSSDARGKLGGLIMSRARGATTLKAHAVPRRAPTPAQSTQRARMASAIQSWRNLTGSNQTTWAVYAASQVWTNSLGTTYSPTGLQLYTQAFINAAYFKATPPANIPPGTIQPPVISTIDISPGFATAEVVVNAFLGTYTGPWIFWISNFISPSRNYTKTISRAFMGTNPGGNFIIFGQQFFERYGNFISGTKTYACAALPVDATSYISGTKTLLNVLANF